MTSRTKKIIGGVVVAVVLILLFLFLWLSSGEQTPTIVNTANIPANTPAGGLNVPGGTVRMDVTQATEPVRTAEEVAAPDIRNNLKRLAAAFAERYGSYSNQGDYRNLEELRSLMTDRLARETTEFVERSRAEGIQSPEYTGITTRALVANVVLFNEEAGTADVTVNTQREEIISAGTRIYYQEINLDFVQEGELWKVDSIEWAEGG
ncbi:hypothetical protein A2480_03590 [Candidatus Uhrbacteria bacterium RIFOXYC2_FULL_47_19]|uniref:Tim44-like domain-containing protein n=1 Tax=Candidatus Uhrbacteria bacterium RIFOXYC2_FULL_47_19 TaxID=1802424 RepID=A0A1F7WBE7_9BACT|nr:MAG: hypothetical protein A2480_03590 [Candidatus Uhrbacteria bacterium RIFOXYC2_FULL_47_19]